MSRKMVSVENLHGYTMDELIELKRVKPLLRANLFIVSIKNKSFKCLFNN
ncbi:hypothetical protein [Clostridium sp. DMHC 10]|nr:hypothetical protein [Clostridium sp. DMHC 10]